ncbi:MAG: dihydropteroate synthase [Ruminococcaceae bacterium]|nr:dihydropteroate synthase [Oscillospiraceae bacterium]
MIIISEKLNSSIPSSKKLMENGTDEEIREFIQLQSECGASYLDLNAAMCADEVNTAKRIADLIIEQGECGIAVDSPSEEAMEAILEYVGERCDVLINSVTLSERQGNIALASKYNAGIIAVLTDESGSPDTAEKRLANADEIIKRIREAGIPDDKIYIDVIAETAAVEDKAAACALETVRLVHEKYENVHITCGLSNISFGLPERKVLNSAFFAAAAVLGMDAPICDITSPSIKNSFAATKILLGEDDYCMEYIEEMRSTK